MADTPLIWDIGEDIMIELTINNPTNGYGLVDQDGFIDLVIQRTSDNYYWNGSAWSTVYTLLVMTQASSTNQPGRYFYILPGTGGNIQADRYLTYARIENPPVIEGDTYEVHVSRTQAVRVYESEPVG